MITTRDYRLIVFTGVTLDLAAGFILALIVALWLAQIVGGFEAAFAFCGALAVFTVLFIVAWHKTAGKFIVAGLTALVVRRRTKQHISRRLEKYATIGAEDGQK